MTYFGTKGSICSVAIDDTDDLSVYYIKIFENEFRGVRYAALIDSCDVIMQRKKLDEHGECEFHVRSGLELKISYEGDRLVVGISRD